MNEIIQKIKTELTRPLPGAKAQLLMAPSVRRDFFQASVVQQAGVLILLYPLDKSLYIAFIKRTEYDGAHSGQISLPGGRFEAGDKSIADTALRETQEELGIVLPHNSLLGQLTALIIPVSNFEVFPFVGYIDYTPEFHPDPNEVKFVIQAKISSFLDIGLIKKKMMTINNIPIEVPFFDIEGNQIWGATAMILSEFVEILRKIGVHLSNI